jgi:hypothetical protein
MRVGVVVVLAMKGNALACEDVVADSDAACAPNESVVTYRRVVADHDTITELTEDARAFNERILTYRDVLPEPYSRPTKAYESCPVFNDGAFADREVSSMANVDARLDEPQPWAFGPKE